MEKVKYGIVGLGNMGRAHRENIIKGNVTGVDLTAICDVSGSLPEKREGEQQFTDVDEMINSGLIDAIHICTPHPSHKEIGIKSLEANLHVLMEKPLAVDKSDCEALINAYEGTGKNKVFAAMFNQRTDPHYKTLKRLIDSDDLGEIKEFIGRLLIGLGQNIITPWVAGELPGRVKVAEFC